MQLSYPGKLRLMLALLTATLLLTAIIAQKTYTPQDNLHQTAKLLEANLHKKESFVYDVLNNKANFDRLKSLSKNGSDASYLSEKSSTDEKIWFITLKNNQLDFWSGIKGIPPPGTPIKEGASFIKEPNGYYEAIKKTDGDFTAIFFIPIKANYAFQNQYLQNTFAEDLLKEDNIEIAGFSDPNVFDIHNINNTYLFSVKLKNAAVSPRLFYFELTFWLLTLITLCLLIQNIATYMSRRGYVISSIIFLGAFIVALRYINLYHDLPNLTGKLEIFNPQLYRSSILFPNLGDFCINILLVCWFVMFLFQQRNRLVKHDPGKAISYLIFISCMLLLLLSITAFLKIFYGMVLNSTISFDVNYVLGLTGYSAIGILMLCFSLLILFLFNEVFLALSKRLSIPFLTQLVIFLTGIVLTTIIVQRYWEFTFVYFLWAVIVVIRGYSYRYANRNLNSGLFASIVFLFAFISAVMLNHFESIKERELRKSLVLTLEKQEDKKADEIFTKIEEKITIDTGAIKSFTDTLHNSDYLKNRFQKLYFDGYLSKYSITIHEFNNDGISISKDKTFSLSDFTDRMQYSSFQESKYFYRETATFGRQNYFAVLPVVSRGHKLGDIAIDLESKPLQIANSFPALLVDGQSTAENEFKNYSYAFYSDNKLVLQHGNYIYNLTNKEFNGVVGKNIFKTTKLKSIRWYNPFTVYNHLIYKPSGHHIIVISREENIIFYDITSLTIYFVIMLVFSGIVVMLRWAWIRIKILNFTDNQLKWSFKINFDRILYKTRIQFSMVFAVVITLILVAVITYISITTQYDNQQNLMIKDKLTRITDSFESGQVSKYLKNINEETQITFDKLADSYSTDLILFDKQGSVLITTQPKIYETGLVARRMNARAYINLNKLQNSEFINDESLGNLNYKSAYAPLKNTTGDVVAYLQLPYFSNEVDYHERIGSLLNIMINIYALIFIAIGLFAVFIARKITSPLSFIQANLGKIIYGKKNEPLKWDRDDEIGALVKEYNNMIAELESSAQKLAQSERESAWREMAKQVAHEIKNPLTPLKLGLQLLEKSWRDKDPKFDLKFERFSKSFVEQIESLSNIASEFSAFAKMPDTRIERINIFNMLNQAVTIFKQMDNLTIEYHSEETPFYINADRDQLLRCFNNLLKNAIEATPPDRPGLINIDYVITDKNILLTIKDNGNGIPESMREKIFEPNFTTKSSGTGLGLAFVKNSIENAGGKVWFETKMGIGTTFFFNLPAAT
jgi:two-component system nitrogen regulation sensor histidine kinase NtrY